MREKKAASREQFDTIEEPTNKLFPFLISSDMQHDICTIIALYAPNLTIRPIMDEIDHPTARIALVRVRQLTSSPIPVRVRVRVRYSINYIDMF